MSTINSVQEFREALAVGPYAWPGGYPLYFVTSDGEAVSFVAAQTNAELIAGAIADGDDAGWRVVALEVNWEDAELYCSHTGGRIESAYAEPE